MPVLKSIRFQKLDKYDNPVFIVNQMEKENYKDLVEKAQQLQDKNFDTFLPIYHSEQYAYATIRFVKCHVIPDPDCVYDIDYVITTKKKDDRTYVNCHMNDLTFVKKIERDEELDLD